MATYENQILVFRYPWVYLKTQGWEFDILVIDFDTRIDTWWVFVVVVVNNWKEKKKTSKLSTGVWFFFFLASQWGCWIWWFEFLIFILVISNELIVDV
jgi:hypothetical protein